MATLSPITILATVPDLWEEAVKALKEKDKQNVDLQRADKRAILVDVLGEVQKKKQACINRRLKYTRSNGDSVHLYDLFEKIVKWVNKFKEVGDAAVQYDPGHAALPWAAIRFLLQVSVNDVQIFGSLVEGLEVVCKTVARYAAIEKLYVRQPSSVDKMLEDSIIATYASILRFLSKCRRNFDLGLGRRVARNVTQVPETSVNKHLDRIAQNDSTVAKLTKIVDAERLQLTGTQQLSAREGIDHIIRDLGELRTESTDSASKLEALLISFKEPFIRTMTQVFTLSGSLVHSKTENQMKEERLRIQIWLSDVQYKKHHQGLSKCLLEGTGSWLFRKPQFIEWRDSSVSSVLWLHGIPGSGKTCLMSTVIRQLQTESSKFENAAPIAYFYCQRNTAEPQRSDPTEVLRAVLKQLLCYNPLWHEGSPTVKEYRARKIEADEDGSEVSRLDILETTDQIIAIASEMPVTIFIDALDECCSGKRHELLGALDSLLERSAHLVKVFISSRDDVDIVLRLQKHPNIYINIYDNKDDINRFISARIEKAQTDGRPLKGLVSSELKTFITENLAMKAGGMFLWVSLQIESLCDSRRIKIEGDLVDELARLPRSLAGMYSLILENIGQIEQHGRTIAETMFRWLLCTYDASSRVTIAVCSGTMSTEHRRLSIPDILDVCSNLVVYDEASDRFRFAHLSVREFLESQPGYTPSEAKKWILERLLQKLTYDQPSEDPFWSFATLNWMLYYNRLEEQHRKEVFELHGKRFLFSGAKSSDAFKTWVAEAHRLEFHFHLKSHLFHNSSDESDSLLVSLGSLSDSEQPPLQGSKIWSNSLYVSNIRSPVGLASHLGWLEILDHHFEMNQSPGDPRLLVGMMAIAIRSDQTSVMRLLIDQIYCLTHEHSDLAFRSRRSEIIQRILEMYRLPPYRGISRDLIKKGANRNCRDEYGHSILFHAMWSSTEDSGIFEDLLLRGIDHKMSDEIRQEALAWAAYTGNLPLVQSILDLGLDPNIKNTKGQTALYFAVQHIGVRYSQIDLETDKEAIVSLLLQRGALVTSADIHGGATLLAHAFKARSSKVAKMLLENGAEPPKGAIAGPIEHLRVAFDQGQEGIRQALLERVRDAQVGSLDLQSSYYFRWSVDPLDIAARLILGGTMRILGDVVLAASGDVNKSN